MTKIKKTVFWDVMMVGSLIYACAIIMLFITIFGEVKLLPVNILSRDFLDHPLSFFLAVCGSCYFVFFLHIAHNWLKKDLRLGKLALLIFIPIYPAIYYFSRIRKNNAD